MAEYSEDLVRKLINTFAELTSLRIKHLPPRVKYISGDEDVDYVEVTADEILNMEGDSIPFLLDPLFPKAGLVGLAGSSDTGKSTFLKQFATAVARGEKEFLGFPLLVNHRSVIYVSTEDDIHGVKSVLKKQRKKGTRSTSIKGLRFIFNSEKIYGQLKKALNDNPADLVIIDAFSDIAPGDVNASHVVRPFLDKFANLSKEHDCLFIFLHHTNKKSEGVRPNKGNVSGSQSFEAKMRLLALLVKDPVELNLRHLCFVKGNYIGDEQKTHSYALVFKEDLTFDYTGERVDFDELSINEDQAKKNKETEELKLRAIEMRKAGNTFQNIADALGPDKTTIRRWCIKAGIESEKKVSQEIDLEEHKFFLEKFVESERKFKSVEDLRSKYEYASKAEKSKIRNRFTKHAKLKQKFTDEQFLELLRE